MADEEHMSPPKAEDFDPDRSDDEGSAPPPPPPPTPRKFDSVPPPGRENDPDRKRRGAVPEMFKRVVERAFETGANRLADTPENLRNFVQEMKLPKEALHYLYQQVDETKNGLYRVVAKEIRDVLEQTHFADELTQVLTKLSFEIKTEIRFIPNDAAPKPTSRKDDDEEPAEHASSTKLPRPEVVAHVSVKDKGKDKDARR